MRLVLHGASYSFALPDGGYGSLYFDSHIQTRDGRVELPGENVLALVGTRHRGRLIMSGQGHHSGFAWVWDGSWRHIVQTALDAKGETFGVSPCAFGDGVLFIATSGYSYERIDLNTGEVTAEMHDVGTQGLRFVENGVPITGDATYRDGELFEWTRRGDVTVGQGHEGGAIINGRILDLGDRRFIRFERAGNDLAVGMVDQPGRQAILHWLTVADIAGLPVYTTSPQPAPAPAPVPPVPVPQPTPEPPKMQAKALPVDIRAIVVELHARNLTLAMGTDDQRRELQQKICETVCARKGNRYGWKSNHGINNANAKDAMAELPEGVAFTPNVRQDLYIWDLFNGTTRAPNPHPIMSETEHTDQFFVPVAPIDHLADVSQPPVQNPGGTPGQGAPPPVEVERPHPSYDAMMALVSDMASAYREGRAFRSGVVMPPATTAHLVYRFLVEGYTAEQLLADARERGQG